MTTTKSAITYTPLEKIKEIENADRDADNPTTFLARLRHDRDSIQRGFLADVNIIDPLPFNTPKPPGHTRFVCISDTHGKHDGLSLPAGDVLFHCGHFTKEGTREEVHSFNEWLGNQSHQRKIVIAGGYYDLTYDVTSEVQIALGLPKGKGTHRSKIKCKKKEIKAKLTNCIYLEVSDDEFKGIRIWGSPWQPGDETQPLNFSRGERILEKWNDIPSDGIDILMTRGPPAGHGDKDRSATNVGCVDLLNSVQLRIQPKYHVFGLIHEAAGITTDHLTTYINCSVVDDDYNLVKPPVIFDFPNKP